MKDSFKLYTDQFCVIVNHAIDIPLLHVVRQILHFFQLGSRGRMGTFADHAFFRSLYLHVVRQIYTVH